MPAPVTPSPTSRSLRWRSGTVVTAEAAATERLLWRPALLPKPQPPKRRWRFRRIRGRSATSYSTQDTTSPVVTFLQTELAKPSPDR